MAKRIIIIGSGAAGMTAASTARELAEDAEITVFTEDGQVAYSPCAIPFVIEGKIADFDRLVMHTPEWYRRERNIQVRVRTKVVGLDIDHKKVRTADGEEQGYDSLVIAAGGTVFVPPVPGSKLPGVFPVRYLDDGRAILQALKGVRSVVVAGAGVIGLEMAVALKHAGKEVTVVEMFPQVFPRIFDPDMAQLVQDHLEQMGIPVLLGAPLGAITGEGKVEQVAVSGKDIPCQMVIMATGVRPNLELVNQAGLEIGPLGGVRVAPSLQPYRKGRLVPEVYLAGDLVMCHSAALPGPTMSQLGSTALRQGRVAGINAAGGHAAFPAVTSPFISVIGDIQVGGVGVSQNLADYYGAKVVEGIAQGSTRARYYPGGKTITVKVLADRETHRLLGAQIVGGEEVTGRINWLAGAIYQGVTAEEFLSGFESAYCPPTAMVRDVVTDAVDQLLRHC